jgi:hypothetical protein
MDGDWVCLHRKILDSRVFSDPFAFQLFAFCILKSNWKPGWFMGHEIARGQLAAGSMSIAKQLDVDRSKVVRGLKKLQEWGCVEVEGVNNRFSIITVCGYSTYQDRCTEDRTTTEQLPNNRRTTTEQPPNTIEQGKQGKQIQQGKQKGARKRACSFDPLAAKIPTELDTDAFHVAWGEWFAYRGQRGLGGYTEMGTAKQLTKLAKIGSDRAVAAIDHSIAESYQGIFEPTGTNGKAKKRESTRI